MNRARAYYAAKRERQMGMAKALYTETHLPVSKIGIEVGCSTNYIFDWIKENGWERPPLGAPRDLPPIKAKEYRERYLAEIGIQLPALAERPPRVAKEKDPFDMTDDASMADARHKRDAEAMATRAKIMKLWNDGLEASIIARRVKMTPDRVRRNLKLWGADLKAPRYVAPKFNMKAAASTTRTRRSNKGMAAVHWRRT